MEYFLFMASKLEPIFYKIVYMSVIATVIGIVILVIRKLLGKKISSKWISRIWLIFIISLIIPLSLKSKISVYGLIPDDIESKFNNINYAQDASEQEQIKKYVVENYERNENVEESLSTTQNPLSKSEINQTTQNEIEQEIQKFDKENRNYVLEMLPVIWIVIVLTVLILYVLTYIVFEIKIHKSTKIDDENLNNILNNCKAKLKIKKNIKLVNQNIINMPSIFGIFRIRILVNNELLKLSDKEIEYVLMHEVAHYKRKDNLLNIFITVLRCVYIFNPVIFILLNKVKKDLELATDELAMDYSNKEEQKEYCKTLVMLSSMNSDKFLIQTLCLSDEKKNLERRIDNAKLIEMFKKHQTIISLFSSFLMILILLVFFAQSSEYMSQKDMVKLMNQNKNKDNYVLEITQTQNNIDLEYSTKAINKKIGNTFSSITLTKYNDLEEQINSIGYIDENEVISIYPESKRIYINKVNQDAEYDTIPNGDYLQYINNYKYCGESMLNGKETYVVECQPESNYGYDANLNKFVKHTTSSKMWIEKETGLLLKEEQNYSSNSEIDEDHIIFTEYKYQYDVLNEQDIAKPDIYEYQDYKIDVQFKEFEEVKQLVNENPKNEKAMTDMQKMNELDFERFKYKYDHFLEIMDDKYVYNVSYNDYTTGEYYKFIINYDDNLVKIFESNVMDANGKIKNNIVNYQ